jgi:hypothetical protein
MNFKNTKNLLLIAAAVMVIGVSFLLYLTHDTVSYRGGSIGNVDQDTDGLKIVDSIDIQNNVLTNYFNSLYDSQVSDIESKYSKGSLSKEERDKQLNAVIKNRELMVNSLNRLSNVKKDILTGNISKQDILTRLNSFNDINSDIKNEFHATLNGS